MIQLAAYSDDSATDNGDQRLFLAGYLNKNETWNLFDIAWREELVSGRAIRYLKMTEANGLRGEFTGWSQRERDDKLSGLIRVIRHFQPMSYEVSLSRKHYKEIMKPAAPRGLNPHFIATFGVVATVARFVAQEKVPCKIEFTFDEQEGVSDDINLVFDRMASSIPRQARRLIAGPPKYQSDRNMPALQAADMLAWHLRREYETSKERGTNPSADLLRNDGGHLVVAIEDVVLERWAAEMSKMPEVKNLQSKGQWQDLRKNLRRALDAGYVPPHGTRLRNIIFALRDRLRR